MPPEIGWKVFCAALPELGIPVETGVFRAHMDVSLTNGGPVTIWLDSAECLTQTR